ncbi:metal ABC transporter substrate-binding protein [Cyanobium sp. PCC 7001]|uniref:metal ABC transporter substrate-binding protein n=1 Tax=Cyanobium sp. PCC 7001 TaxID=180281 RepID=UPI000318F50A|nr:metal ABC transporter substrate-binding protein [Cyanobium sp. PCC 7001]
MVRGCAAALVGLLAVSCTRSPSGLTPAGDDGRPVVLTTFTVLADLAREVAGDRLRVESITKQGAEIHGYQPTPSDIERASRADLILENGLGLELWARKFTAAAGNVPTVTLTEGLTPLPIEEDAYTGKPNPHAWMSPQRAMHYVDQAAAAFSQLDPKGAPVFRANAEAYKSRLRQLDQELRTTLATIPPAQRVLVSCEGAFTYLARDYGLKEAYLWPVNAESEVTPQRMTRLIATIKERQVPTIFCESTVSDEAQREVARATGARFGGTFYVDSLSGPDGPASTLLDLQRYNVGLILKGLNATPAPAAGGQP